MEDGKDIYIIDTITFLHVQMIHVLIGPRSFSHGYTDRDDQYRVPDPDQDTEGEENSAQGPPTFVAECHPNNR